VGDELAVREVADRGAAVREGGDEPASVGGDGEVLDA
jgi:hypothetical protein